MQFKTLALATTSLVALGLAAATPAAEAKTGMMGRVDIDFSYYWDDWRFGSEGSSSDFEDEYTTVIAAGRVNIPYDEWYNIQADIFSGYSLDNSGGSGQVGHAGVGVHFNYRDSQHGLLGVYAALGRANASFGGESSYNGLTYLTGIEGQYYCQQWTFYGQIGYWDSEHESGLLENAGFIRTAVSYYVSPQLKLTGALKYINGEVPVYFDESGVDSDAWDYVLRVDYMFGRTMPVAVFFEYGGRNAQTNNPSDDDSELDVNRVNVGVTFYLGGEEKSDLMYQDRMGAGLSIPDFDEIRAPEPFINN